ncbi:hypothetical protein [Streptomyces afghaniensis]|uniref:hypothetical protein n=1 Tax=Streptomyces afghaniensis TaxID=66865 RepID=UPI002782F310|nr:hypothetical protein [Streptomyces afghaniensis]MDQ1018986.1 hypothetical protein [Streptomyces afghaniensis]
MDTMTVAGARPIGEIVDVFVIYDDGTPAHMQILAEAKPTLSRPGRLVSEEQYGKRLQELRASSAAHVAALEAQDEARHQEDYEALLGAGVPEESARRMAGYTGGQS